VKPWVQTQGTQGILGLVHQPKNPWVTLGFRHPTPNIDPPKSYCIMRWWEAEPFTSGSQIVCASGNVCPYPQMLEIRAVGELSLRIKKTVSSIRSMLKRKSLSSPPQKRRRFPRVLPQPTISSDDRSKSGCMAKSSERGLGWAARVSCSIRVSEVLPRIFLKPFRA